VKNKIKIKSGNYVDISGGIMANDEKDDNITEKNNGNNSE